MRWLHLSDLHYSPETDGRSSRQLRERLPEYIREQEIHGDEVFITGDFRHAFWQKDEDIRDTAKKSAAFIREIAESAGVNDTRHIHIVPGNHDLTRKTDAGSKERINTIIKNYDCNSGNFKPDDLKFLLGRFDFFRCVCTELYQDKSPWREDTLHTYRFTGSHVLLCMNTAITHEQDTDRGSLIIGNSCLYDVLEKIKKEHRNVPIIALAHHAPEFFAKAEREAVEGLFRQYPVKLYLCGDAHDVWYRKADDYIEITMGCIKQDKGTDCVFENGDTIANEITAHKWDVKFSDWTAYSAFNMYLHKLMGERETGREIPHAQGCFLGRTGLIERIIPNIQPNQAVILHGAPGMGKTEVCVEIINQCAKKGWHGLYVKLQGREGYAGLLNALCEALDIDQNSKKEDIINALKYRERREPAILYLDNFEDVLYCTKDLKKIQDRDSLDLLKDLKQTSNVCVLISCRENLLGIGIPFELPGLPPETAKDLFLRVWNGTQKIPENEMGTLTGFVKTGLACHPLSIVLAASQGYHVNTVENLIGKWPLYKAMGTDGAENPSHTSLKNAVYASFLIVEKDTVCRKIWGVTSFFSSELKQEHYRDMLQLNDAEIAEALRRMRKLNLLQSGENGYTMLPSLRHQSFEYIGSADEDGIENILRLIADFFDRLLMEAEKLRNHTNQSRMEVLYFIDDLLSFLDQLLNRKNYERLAVLIFNMTNYYKYRAYTAALVLNKIIRERHFEHLPAFIKPIVKKSLGNLQDRLGEPDKAMELYNQAGELFRAEKANLGLANTLRSKGDMQNRLSKHDEAMKLYEEAEALYRAEKANLGLANTLQGKGNLQNQLGEPEKAMALYEQAEALYRTEKNNLGLANTLFSKGDLQRRLGEPEKALALYGEAEALYRVEKANLGLANTLQSKGDLQNRSGKHDEAMKLYEEAEELYRTEKDNLGLANTLQSKGDLHRETKYYLEAVRNYEAALSLYISEQEVYGIGYATGELCRAYALNGDREPALCYMDKALEACKSLPDNVTRYIQGCVDEARKIL